MKTPCRNYLKYSTLLSFLLAAVFALGGCSNPEKAKAEHLSKGEAYLKESKFQEASIEFRNAIQIDGKLAAAHWGLARAYEGLQRAQEAVEELRKTTELDPNNMEARSKLGNIYLGASRGRPEYIAEAERLAKEMLQRDPNYIEGHILMGSVLFAQNKRDEAFAQLNQAIELNPKRIESYLSLARFYIVSKEPAKAEEVFKRAISIDNNSALVHTEYAAKRATYLSQAEDAAVNFFGRLQRPDGSWRWDANTSPDPKDQNRNVEQPFMSGLYLESVTLLHQLTSRRAIKAKLVEQLTKSVTHLYRDAYERSVVSDFPKQRWRAVVYFWGGGTVAHPGRYSPPRPRGESRNQEGGVPGARHLNSTIHHAFGYAYYVTGDPAYKEMGDEIFDASYGDRVDGIHCLADSGKGKDYAMNYRSSGRYLVWRLDSTSLEHKPRQ